MTATIYTAHNTPTTFFAEKDGQWYSVKADKASPLPEKPLTPMIPVDISLHPTLRRLAKSL